MTQPLFQNPDGANDQARAVLAYLSGKAGIEESWNSQRNDFGAKPTVARWYNCREQGYVVSMRSKQFAQQINIAFFEHRNSDDICAVEWEECTTNPPTIDSEAFRKVYKDKWFSSHSESVGRASEMADWIFERLTAFWIASQDEPSFAERRKLGISDTPPTPGASR